jgi:hypothetical protein
LPHEVVVGPRTFPPPPGALASGFAGERPRAQGRPQKASGPRPPCQPAGFYSQGSACDGNISTGSRLSWLSWPVIPVMDSATMVPAADD